MCGGRLLAPLISLGLFLSLSPGTYADDARLRNDMQELLADDADARMAALDRLVQSRDGRLADFLAAYQGRDLYLWDGQLVYCDQFQENKEGVQVGVLLDPLTGEPVMDGDAPAVVPKSALESVAPSRRDRRSINEAQQVLESFSDDVETRLTAIQQLGNTRDPKFLPDLRDVLKLAEDEKTRFTTRESIGLIELAGEGRTRDERWDAARELAELRSTRGAAVLEQLLADFEERRLEGKPVDQQTETVYQQSFDQIESYQAKIRWVKYLFDGISLGSILILLALGLSIIFGQMGVINMAHGELMIIGAYATYEMQLWFGHSPADDTIRNWFFVAALPVAFLSAAVVGWLIEKLVVQHLYGRPLDTLLATWGVSLVLIQAIRIKYGDNIEMNSPTWLQGKYFEPVQDLIIPYNRAFIVVLCAVCVFAVYWLMNYTRVGLLIRATVQGRETAGSLGVNTRRTDAYTFALGSGIAGIAGFAWTLVGTVTPDAGQKQIVDSFLVVVTGGVGKLAGTVGAGFAIGTLNKLLEPVTFGEGLLILGLLTALVAWIVGAVKAFRQDRTWGWISLVPVPGPVPFAVKLPATGGIKVTAGFYVAGLIGVLAAYLGFALNHSLDSWVEWLGKDSFLAVLLTDVDGILSSTIQAVWAKILLLICVVLFIQWRPMGLFPPKGRLADV